MKQLIIGIDLGLTNLGVSCIDEKEKILDYRVFNSPKKKGEPTFNRLRKLAQQVSAWINGNMDTYTPLNILLSIEAPIFIQNFKTSRIFARLLQELWSTLDRDLPLEPCDKIIVLAPTQVKKTFTGNGRATKTQVIKEVKTMTWEGNLEDMFTCYKRVEQEAIADAIAIAVAGKRLIGKRRIIDE
jgi:Holliday junction resolvasome RuvABC endonuclease subunit